MFAQADEEVLDFLRVIVKKENQSPDLNKQDIHVSESRFPVPFFEQEDPLKTSAEIF